MSEQMQILPLAFALGLVHALDADHLLAVSAATNGNRPGNTLKFCLHWALGHGLTVFVVCFAVIVLGIAIPVTISQLAEAGVGLLLLLLGLWIAGQHYLGMPRENHCKHVHRPGPANRAAPFVGILHGLAGSAPLLLVFPFASLSITQALVFVALFCLGVLLAMLAFGSLLNRLWITLFSYTTLCRRFRLGLAIVTLLTGCYLFSPAIGGL